MLFGGDGSGFKVKGIEKKIRRLDIAKRCWVPILKIESKRENRKL